MKNVAVLGGAFDPVHKDHMRVARTCLDRGFCDEVWFMPSPDRWDKTLNASPEDRFAMLELAAVVTAVAMAVTTKASMASIAHVSTMAMRRDLVCPIGCSSRSGASSQHCSHVSSTATPMAALVPR